VPPVARDIRETADTGYTMAGLFVKSIDTTHDLSTNNPAMVYPVSAVSRMSRATGGTPLCTLS